MKAAIQLVERLGAIVIGELRHLHHPNPIPQPSLTSSRSHLTVCRRRSSCSHREHTGGEVD